MNLDDEAITNAEMRRALDEQDDRIARTSGTSRIVNAPATSDWRTVERHRAALRSAFESPAYVWVDGVEVTTGDGSLVVVAEALAAFDAAPALRDADWIMTRAAESWTRLILDTCAVIAHACGWQTFTISEQDTWASSKRTEGQHIGRPGTFLPNRP